jgi:voltage-gated potassium channel
VGVLRDKKEQIGVALVAVLVVLVLASSAMYFVERRVQPEHFSSIPDAMWWGIVTLTTVGYGDVHPTTTIGKVLGGIISLMGIGLFALPAGILSSGFEQALEERHGEAGQQEDDEGRASGEGRYCPHCGSDLAGRGSEGREEPTTSSGGR